MHTRTLPSVVVAMMLLVPVGAAPAQVPRVGTGAQRGADANRPTAEETAQIAEAATAADALSLARNFHSSSRTPAAIAAIEKAISLEPDLLFDKRPQTPRPWNEFWFAQRAAIQEKKLAPTDAEGRLRIVEWLATAGQRDAASAMLKRLLVANPDLPGAEQLAQQFNLAPSGPMRFDFRFATQNPLFVEKFVEENVDTLITRGKVFLILPFAYSLVEPFVINKGQLRVTGDDGRVCSVRGIALLDASTSSMPGAALELKLPADSEPLYEKIALERKTDRSGTEFAAYNTTPPIARPTPRAPGERPTPQPLQRRPRDPNALPGGKVIRDNPSGYAAFVIEVPETMQHIDVEYRSVPPMKPVRFTSAFLASLSLNSQTPTEEREPMLATLIAAAEDKEGQVAAGAVIKLASLLPRTEGTYGGPPTAAPVAPTDRVLRTLITATAHPDGLTRQAALDALFRPDGRFPPELPIEIRRMEAAPLLAMLEGIGVILTTAVPPEGTQPQPSQIPGAGDVVARAVEGLPSSYAPASVFAALGACLAAKDARVREKAVELLLSDHSRQSVETLATASGAARDALIGLLGKVDNPEFKAAVLRVLIARADKETVVKLLKAAGPLKVAITRDDDPFLAALNNPSSPESIALLLRLLSNADLTAVARSEQFRKVLDAVATAQQKNPEAQKALLELAAAQVRQLPYQAPIRRESQSSGGYGSSSQVSAFESLLAMIAVNADVATARTAVETLIASGRIAALTERWPSASPRRRVEILQFLASRKELWERESLPIFIAQQFKDTETTVLQGALAALATVQKGYPAEHRWRFNLAVKQGIEAKQLVELSVHPEALVADPARDILMRLAMMPTNLRAEFEAGDRSVRDESLANLDRVRSSRPSGPYMAMLYLDLEPVNLPGSTPQPDAVAGLRSSVPLVGPSVVLEATPQSVRVMADGTNIEAAPRPGAPAAAPGSPAVIRINLAPLLQLALLSPEAEKQGLTGQLDMVALNEPRELELKYEQLGTWSGEMSLRDTTRAGTSAKPLRVSAVKLILEPVPPK